MKRLSILTATYNRCTNLCNLYDNLCKQDTTEFVWCVVDDGSGDDTQSFVQKWKKEGLLEIEYLYQPNKGVHVARAVGKLHIQTPWVMTVDSDDLLADGAVSNVLKLLDDYNLIEDDKCAGLLTPMINEVTTDVKEGNFSLSDQYYKYDAKGEYSLVVKSEIMKRFIPPNFYGEKFVTESAYLRKIDYYYYYKCVNQRFVIREYQEDGLTKNISEVIKNSPYGQAYAMKVDSAYGVAMGVLKRAQKYADYVRYCENYLAKTPDLFPEIKIPMHIEFLARILYLPDSIWKYWRCKFSYSFPKEIIPAKSKIILWGAGNMGQAYYYVLDKNKYCEVTLWVDSDYVVKQAQGLSVVPTNTIWEHKEYDYILVAIQSPQEYSRVQQLLLDGGIKKDKIVIGRIR